jgi:hypothetical protein
MATMIEAMQSYNSSNIIIINNEEVHFCKE